MIDVLDLGGDALHASVLCWLLDPAGAHGLGPALLALLETFTQSRGVAWTSGDPEHLRTSVRRSASVHAVELRSGAGGQLHIVVGGHGMGCDRALLKAQSDEDAAIGLHLVPGAFSSDVRGRCPVWTGRPLLDLLEQRRGQGELEPFLVHYARHLEDIILERSARRAGTSTKQRPNARSTGHTRRVARAKAEQLTDEARSRLSMVSSTLGAGSEPPPKLELEEEILPSDDMSRAYTVKRLLGQGGQGYVFEVEIQGDQEFSQFLRPVTHAVIKIAREGGADAIRREEQIYAQPDPGIIRMLDSGTANDSPYLILEKLNPHMHRRFEGVRLDAGTAVDTFIHLLRVLAGIQFRRRPALILCDIKPDNVMLRMSNAGEDLSSEEYLRRLATGAYEPVFMDMGCALDRRQTEENGGSIGGFIGTPAYLPPEATPNLNDPTAACIYTVGADAYALTLTFYELLTSLRPYEHRGLYKLTGEDLLVELFAFKHDLASPIDEGALSRVLDSTSAAAVLEILRAGTEPDPSERASVQALLSMCRKQFEVTERRKKDTGNYHFDSVKGLTLWQNRFPRLSVEKLDGLVS